MILQLQQKALVVYGTGSVMDLDSDYLPLEIDKANKKNITVLPFLGYDHNYFETVFDKNGKLLEKKFHWDDVMVDVMKWVAS